MIALEPPVLDHIVYAVPKLEVGVRSVAEQFGLQPVPGGSHQGYGTANALIALGEDCYLEIIGPDPDQPKPPRPRPFGIDGLEAPRLVTWAVRTADLEGRVTAARAAGYDPGIIVPMARLANDGTRLEWRLAVPESMGGPMFGDGLVPFLIDWGGTPHPAAGMEQRCSLIELRGTHPDPASIQASLAALGVELQVAGGDHPALVAIIEAPGGLFELA